MNRIVKAAIAAGAMVSLLVVGQHGAPADPAMQKEALNYFYAEAEQTGMNPSNGTVGPVSASALMDPAAPTIGTGDFHSLAEIFAGKDINNGIEVGWTVDATGINGTDHTNPHLFVGAWVNGNFLGYNNAAGSGWVDYSGNADDAGKLLTTGTAVEFGMQHSGSVWWVYYNTAAIGDFPDSLWSATSNTFTNLDRVQVFGEVAGNSTSPHTQMGKGVLASATSGACPCTGAKISSMTYTGGSGAVVPLLVKASDPNPTKYNSVLLASNKTLYYGGPGF